MATITINHCGERGGGGHHITCTIVTARGTVVRELTREDFNIVPDLDLLADMILKNAIIRAKKSGAVTADQIKSAIQNVVYQEI